MKIKKCLPLFTIILLFHFSVEANDCSIEFPSDKLQNLKDKQFEVDDDKQRNATALKLLSCIGHQNPDIRDGIVYEGLSSWLRNGLLERATTRSLFSSLLKLLSSQNQDPNNYTQPFTALVLSEVVRVDRITPYLSASERQTVIDVSTQYMSGITDYRGFTDKEGWRHAVAHTSDIFLQLALNENISKKQLNQMLLALGQQVSPVNGYSYIHGESKRLATTFAYIVLRGEQTAQEVIGLLNKLASPLPFEDWGSVYKSEQGLAKLHNTRAFIVSLFALTSQSKNPNLIAIKPTLVTIIRELG